MKHQMDVVGLHCTLCGQSHIDIMLAGATSVCPGVLQKKIKEEDKPSCYLASPLGFAAEMRSYKEKIKAHITSLGYIVRDPWDHLYENDFKVVARIDRYEDRLVAFNKLADKIGRVNEEDLIASTVVLGVLDGMEPDSGTVAEIAFGSALGKKCYGLRTDIRYCGDFPGVPLNLQVMRFIKRSGGELFYGIDGINLP